MTDATKISVIFENIMGWQPSFDTFEERLEMQKIVYLLYEEGISCGNYRFRWYLHGPYSQQLQNVMISTVANQNAQGSFSEDGLAAFDEIKALLKIPHDGYSTCDWLEALGSILYLEKHASSMDTRESIIAKLEKLKGNLNISSLNNLAFDTLKANGWFAEFE